MCFASCIRTWYQSAPLLLWRRLFAPCKALAQFEIASFHNSLPAAHNIYIYIYNKHGNLNNAISQSALYEKTCIKPSSDESTLTRNTHDAVAICPHRTGGKDGRRRRRPP